MEAELQQMLIDGLTDAIKYKNAVTIKSSNANTTIVITASQSDIIVSLAKRPVLMEGIIELFSMALSKKPDIVYDRESLLVGEFRIYYSVWILDYDKGSSFIAKEFSLPQNNITYLSDRAKNFLKNI